MVSDVLGIAFFASSGSILYVVIELLAVARAVAVRTVRTWGVLAGLVLGFGIDAVITYAGP